MNEEVDCTVCASPVASQIESLLECGASVIEMAEHTGLPVEEIVTHLRHVATMPESAAEANGDPLRVSDARLQVLLSRMNQVYVAAGLQAHTRTQVAALSAQVRLELEFRRREESRAKHEALLDEADPLAPVNTWPKPLQDFLGAWMDGLLTRIVAERERRGEP